jgi:hypothetical protein
MDAAAPAPGAAQGLVRILEHCEALGRLTQCDHECARGRLETALGRELAGLLLGALTRRAGHAALPV